MKAYASECRWCRSSVEDGARLDEDDGGELGAAYSASPQGGSHTRRSDLY